MFAVIKTGGKQYIVEPGKKLKIEKLELAEGEKAVFDEVLLVSEDENVKVGQPKLAGAKVEADVLKQGKADKIIVFKYKPKKRYQVKKGHRQMFTEVEIKNISI